MLVLWCWTLVNNLRSTFRDYYLCVILLRIYKIMMATERTFLVLALIPFDRFPNRQFKLCPGVTLYQQFSVSVSIRSAIFYD